MPITLRFSPSLLRCATAGCLALSLVSLPARAEDAKPATPAPTEQPRRPQADVSQYLTVLRDRMNELKLSADQKTKVDAIFSKATDELKKVQEETKDADPQERMQKVRAALGGFRGQVAEVLTDEQKTKFQDLTARGPQGNRAAGAGIDQLAKNLEKLDLTDDQKAKVKTLLDDTRKAMESLRAEAQKDGNREALREKAQNITQDLRTHLTEILTPEQTVKLREAMVANRPTPPGSAEKPTEKKGS